MRVRGSLLLALCFFQVSNNSPSLYRIHPAQRCHPAADLTLRNWVGLNKSTKRFHRTAGALRLRGGEDDSDAASFIDLRDDVAPPGEERVPLSAINQDGDLEFVSTDDAESAVVVDHESENQDMGDEDMEDISRSGESQSQSESRGAKKVDTVHSGQQHGAQEGPAEAVRETSDWYDSNGEVDSELDWGDALEEDIHAEEEKKGEGGGDGRILFERLHERLARMAEENEDEAQDSQGGRAFEGLLYHRRSGKILRPRAQRVDMPPCPGEGYTWVWDDLDPANDVFKGRWVGKEQLPDEQAKARAMPQKDGGYFFETHPGKDPVALFPGCKPLEGAVEFMDNSGAPSKSSPDSREGGKTQKGRGEEGDGGPLMVEISRSLPNNRDGVTTWGEHQKNRYAQSLSLELGAHTDIDLMEPEDNEVYIHPEEEDDERQRAREKMEKQQRRDGRGMELQALQFETDMGPQTRGMLEEAEETHGTRGAEEEGAVYFPKGFLLKQIAGNKSTADESTTDDAATRVKGIDPRLRQVWIWSQVEAEVNRMKESADEAERRAGQDMREAIDSWKPTPGVARLFFDAAKKLDETLHRGDDPPFPSSLPPPAEMLRMLRLSAVFESRSRRELNGKEGVDPYLEWQLSPHFTDEERTRWPWVALPHWTFDINKGRTPLNETAVERHVAQVRQKWVDHFDADDTGERWRMAKSSLSPFNPNSSDVSRMLDEVLQVEDDIAQGRCPRPEGYMDLEQVFRALGVDPHGPITPIPVGEGKDIWGPHPINATCRNTYCRYCYDHSWTGEPLENPRFAGRQLVDLSNDELHILGQNPIYNALPPGVHSSAWNKPNRPITDALREAGPPSADSE